MSNRGEADMIELIVGMAGQGAQPSYDRDPMG
jgi:hypothetical protein